MSVRADANCRCRARPATMMSPSLEEENITMILTSRSISSGERAALIASSAPCASISCSANLGIGQ